MPNFPEESKWLSEDEKAYVSARLRLDQGQSARDRPIGLKDVGRVFKDYKVIVAGFMYFGLIVPAYGKQTYIQGLHEMKYSSIHSTHSIVRSQKLILISLLFRVRLLRPRYHLRLRL